MCYDIYWRLGILAEDVFSTKFPQSFIDINIFLKHGFKLFDDPDRFET